LVTQAALTSLDSRSKIHLKQIILIIFLILFNLPCWANNEPSLTTVCAQLLEVLNNETLLNRIRESKTSILQKNLYDFAQLDIEQIEKLTEQPINRAIFLDPQVNISDYRGSSTFAIYTGRLNGKKIFIKVSHTRYGEVDSGLLSEAHWLTYLEATKVVPQLFGFVKINGRLGMVSEQIEGYQIYFGIEKRIELLKKMWTLEERQLIAMQFLTIGKILEHLGPMQMIDPQYRLSPIGRTVLIDLASFQWSVPSNPHQQPISWSKKLAAQILEVEPE